MEGGAAKQTSRFLQNAANTGGGRKSCYSLVPHELVLLLLFKCFPVRWENLCWTHLQPQFHILKRLSGVRVRRH